MLKLKQLFGGSNSYQISKERIRKLEIWRQKFGTFKNVEEILVIDGFGVKVLEKFCASVLNETPSDNKQTTTKTAIKSRSLGGMTIPNLCESQRKSVKSCVSVYVGISHITWSHFVLDDEQPISLLDWKHFEIEDKKLHLSDLVNNVVHINRLIPNADVYVLENPLIAQAGAPGSVLQVNISIQKAQLVAMISLVLANRKNQTVTGVVANGESDRVTVPTVFYLKNFLSSRLFGLLIGNEKISTESIVLSILRTHLNTDDDNLIHLSDEPMSPERVNTYLNANQSLREMYRNSSNVQKEFMGQSLLMGLAFIRLCILKCPLSLEKVGR